MALVDMKKFNQETRKSGTDDNGCELAEITLMIVESKTTEQSSGLGKVIIGVVVLVSVCTVALVITGVTSLISLAERIHPVAGSVVFWAIVLAAAFFALYGAIETDKPDIQKLRLELDYPEVARQFRMIEQDTRPLLVCYEPKRELFERVRSAAQAGRTGDGAGIGACGAGGAIGSALLSRIGRILLRTHRLQAGAVDASRSRDHFP